MLRDILLGMLAALGLFSALWAVCGAFLLNRKGCILVHWLTPGAQIEGVLLHYRWLRELRLVKAPLLIVDTALSEAERQRIIRAHPHVEFCSPEALPSRLELENG